MADLSPRRRRRPRPDADRQCARAARSAALEWLEALEPMLQHALETLAGPFDHGAAGAATRPGPTCPTREESPR